MKHTLKYSGKILLNLPIILGFCLPTFSQERSDLFAAVVNGETITTKEVDDIIKRQLQNMEQQANKLRQTTLTRLMDNALLRQAAEAEKLTVESFLKSRVEGVIVSDNEVEQAFSNSIANFPGMLPAEVKYRIRRTLEDNKRQARHTELLQTLRSRAQVKNFLIESPLIKQKISLEGAPSIGPSDALVTIVSFSDFQCSFCRTAQPIIRDVLTKQRQQVRFVFKHFPLQQHSNAFVAAKASWCADRQDQFWKFHDRAFQEGRRLDASDLQAIGDELGLDTIKLNSCIASREANDAVQKDYGEGIEAGVSGTPTLFVNNVRIASVAELEATIRAQLDRQLSTKSPPIASSDVK